MIFYVVETVYVIALTAHLLEGIRVEYKMFSPNCDMKNVNIAESHTSVDRCAMLCVQLASCRGFVMRRGECGLLQTCPSCCTRAQKEDDGWIVYCPYGKLLSNIIYI